MVSRGNVFPAQLAIDCYRSQTYANRELVIVCAQPSSPLSDFVAGLNDPSIRYIETSSKSLGELRNASVAAARGSLLCTWDDDDLYASRRLEVQASKCLETDAAAHFLSRLLIWWPDRRLLAITAQRHWEGSMLVRREAIPEYPAWPLREDTDVLNKLESRYTLTGSNEPELYCYVVHSANTCDFAHFEHIFEQAEWVYSDYEAELARLSAKFPLRWYADGLLAKSQNIDSGIPINGTRPLIVVSDKIVGSEEIRVDGIHFKRCRFEGTKLVYFGGGPPLFEDCEILGAAITFHGSASNTLNWLRQLKREGMVIEGL